MLITKLHSVVEAHHSLYTFPTLPGIPTPSTVLLCGASPKCADPHLRNPYVLIYGKSLCTVSLYDRLHRGSPFRIERAREQCPLIFTDEILKISWLWVSQSISDA